MKYALAVCAFLAVGLFAGRSSACEIISLRQGLPREGGTLGLGSVIGYGTATHPTPLIETAPSLIVRIEVVVSGNISSLETEVVPLFFGPDCHSTPNERRVLETSFPVGATIAFSTSAVSRGNALSAQAIVVESNKGDFVVRVPPDVVRTRHGDLDFEHFDAAQSWQFGEFEFARAVFGLRRARQSEKLERLLNLAHYQEFRDRQGREWLNQLISENRLTASQRKAVLTASGEQLPRAR